MGTELQKTQFENLIQYLSLGGHHHLDDLHKNMTKQKHPHTDTHNKPVQFKDVEKEKDAEERGDVVGGGRGPATVWPNRLNYTY